MYEVEPPLIWWNGEVVPWADARIHVTSETALRGLNVFEGIRAYWRPTEKQFAVVWLRGHLRRLEMSAGLLEIPFHRRIDGLAQGIAELLRALDPREDVYIRPTVYVESGRYTSNNEEIIVGTFVACHATGPRNNEPINCAVSRVRRIPDTALSALAKTGAAYTVFRMARLEALRRGHTEAILLNSDGHVAETPGAAVFVLRQGRLSTPPLSDGVLDSLTRRTVIRLAERELGLHVAECSVGCSELYTADEVFLAGTLDEVRVVGSVDGHLPRDPHHTVGNALRTAYLGMCDGRSTPIDDAFLELLP